MRCAHCLAVAPTPLTSQWPPTDRGCLRAPGTGSCTHAAHLTVAANGPELFEGSRDRLPKLALKKVHEIWINHVPGRTATLEAWAPILRLSISLDRIVWTPAAPHSLIATGRLRRPE